MVKTEGITKFLIAEKRNRKFLLEGNLWKVIFYFTSPIIIYWVFQNISDSIDLLILKRNNFPASQITFLSRVHLFKGILIPFGISIATGGVILVGRAYGQNNLEKMRLYLAKTFILSILIGLILSVLCIFVFQKPILESILGISKTHSVNIEQRQYYNLIIISFVCISINTVFLSLERAKGNNKVALLLNLLNACVKIILSLVLFYSFDLHSITSLAWATFISNAIITLFALWFLFFDQNNPFKIILKKLRFDKKFLQKIAKLAIPVCASISVYGLGKLIVSIVIRDFYDGGPEKLTSAQIGANLALAVTINNIFYNLLNSFSDSQNAIISQNLGHNNLNRVFEAFKKIIFCMFIFATLGTLINCFGYKIFLPFFHNTAWEQIPALEQEAFRKLLFFETTSLWLSCGSIILFNFLLAFKKVAPSFYLNFLRSVFRVFFIFLFAPRCLNWGVTGVGLSIFLSNLLCFIITFWIFITFYLKLKRERTFERD
ncbi:MATE family efflux transporter [Candidatus Phytoplasma solani]|uniref:Na+ driven multidrug efflux pump n=1 Tax=Candidatus Phytoplasma solani TaxID=69896 RepID=A0A421NUL5_9MOLU|nr:MATE family efflux transporter [Candidatus Phytoplasma solani]RMI87695.1 Na+ driven multidrug efflux pump [Candidatus Phytoplasma solani]CCP87999.1 Na+ driven multidrug efflux pump [Candidatus Phytoplasma solani]CCP88541.1 Na+ driven multidrug efflux pump [Candidatus Phytoplasma solani]